MHLASVLYRSMSRLLALWGVMIVTGWAQVPHLGQVRAKGFPVPGAAVSATLGSQTVSTTTDEDGAYQLELSPGNWTLSVRMFGFAADTRPIVVPSPKIQWNLELLARPAASNDSAESTAFELPADLPLAAVPPVSDDSANEAFLVTGSLSRGLQSGPAEAALDPGAGPGMGGPEGMRERMGGMLGSPGGPERFAGGFGGPGSGDPGLSGGPGEGPRGGNRPGSGEAIGGPGAKRGAPGGREGRFARAGGARPSFGNRQRRARQSVRGMVTLSARDSTWNARPYSLTGLLYDKPDQSLVRMSAMIGGTIPKTKRSQFIFQYSLGRGRTPFSGVATVPTLLERSGDFSQSLVRGPTTIYDPQSGLPFPNNRIPDSRVHPAAQGLLNLIPNSNVVLPIQNYQFVTGVPQNSQSISLRVNHPLTAKDRVSVNVGGQSRDGQSAQLFGFLDESAGHSYNADLSWTRNYSARLIQTIRTRIARNTSDLVPFFANKQNLAADLGIRGAAQDPLNYGPPNLNFTNFGRLADGSPLRRRDLNVNLAASFVYVKGQHSLSFGGDTARVIFNNRTDSNARGTFTFSGLATSRIDANGVPVAASGFDFADFLLGLPQSSSIRFGSPSNYFRAQNYSLFVQDEWKATPNLTLNFGLRYEYYSPWTEKFDRLANLDISPGVTGVAAVSPGQSGPFSGSFSRALIDGDPNNLAPRFGFAWKPNRKLRTTVRGSYGWFYNGNVYQNFATRLASQPPFASTGTLNTSAARRLTLDNGFAVTPSQNITNTFAVDRGYRIGYAQTWSLSIQREVKRNYVMEFGYLGTKGTRLDLQRLPNRAAPGSPVDSEARRLLGNAVGFTFDTSQANSIFHAAQARLTRRFARGVSLNTLYTFGKSIDNASSIGGGGGGVVAQDDRNWAAERGLSSFNVRHALTTSFVLASPVTGRRGGLTIDGALGAILRNWTLTGALSVTSGTPLTARVLGNQSDTAGTGVIGSGRADASGQPIDAGPGFFNLLAFSLPPSGRFGNAVRNTIPTPTLFTLNSSFGRSFRLKERRQLELRLESNNLTNRPTFTNLGTVVNASNYGLPLNAAGMRTMQIQVRFRF